MQLGLEPDPYEPIAAELSGPDRLDASEASELRLRYADRLRRDVAELSGR